MTVPQPSPSFASMLSPAQVRRGREHDAVDGVVPPLAVAARTPDDVRTIVAEAARERSALIAVGTGSRLELGNRPAAFDVRVSLAGMARILEHKPEDLTVAVEAGVGLARLNRILGRRRQRVSLDPAPSQQATVGGLVATDATGGLAHRFGTPRDLVLGLTAVDGRGRLLRTGGRVVKNVAGYDLPRLFTGSCGTLGIITEVVLRTHPLPDDRRTLRFAFAASAELAAAAAALRACELPLSACDFEATLPASWMLVVCVEGTDEDNAYQSARLGELCMRPPHEGDASVPELPGSQWESPIHPHAGDNVVVRIGTNPATIIALAEELLELAPTHAETVRVAGRLGDGLLRLCARCTSARDAFELVTAIRRTTNGRARTAVVERVPLAVKDHIDVWGGEPGGLALMRGIKRVFDPDSLFSPGRFVGGL